MASHTRIANFFEQFLGRSKFLPVHAMSTPGSFLYKLFSPLSEVYLVEMAVGGCLGDQNPRRPSRSPWPSRPVGAWSFDRCHPPEPLLPLWRGSRTIVFLETCFLLNIPWCPLQNIPSLPSAGLGTHKALWNRAGNTPGRISSIGWLHVSMPISLLKRQHFGEGERWNA